MRKRFNKRSRRSARRGSRRNTSGGYINPTIVHDVKMPRPVMYNPGRVSVIQLRGYTNLATDGSGIINTFIPTDPSAILSSTYMSGAAMFTEWNNVKALFNEIKFKQLDIRITTGYTFDGKQAAISPLALGSLTSSVVGAPGSYGNVLDNGDAQEYAYALDNSGRARLHSLRFNVQAYCGVGSPNGGSSVGISAGCPGAIYLYAGNGPVGVSVASIIITGTYYLRTRV